jgi:hypothetical protein
MSACGINCNRNECSRLVLNATPILASHVIISFDTRVYCSRCCADHYLIGKITGRSYHCYRMIAREVYSSTIEPQVIEVHK